MDHTSYRKYVIDRDVNELETIGPTNIWWHGSGELNVNQRAKTGPVKKLHAIVIGVQWKKMIMNNA